MKRLSPHVVVVALAALALTACQAKTPAPVAEAAPVDPQVAAAVTDARAAAIDPATGKARDSRTVFAAQAQATDAPVMPSGSLGDGNAMNRNLQTLSPAGGESAN